MFIESRRGGSTFATFTPVLQNAVSEQRIMLYSDPKAKTESGQDFKTVLGAIYMARIISVCGTI